MSTKPKRPPPRSPWDSPRLEPGEVAALKALRSGTANDGQQQTAYDVIVNVISGKGRLSFVGGEDGRRATDFAEGRRWVGLMVQEACEIVVPVNPRGAEPAMPSENSKRSE